MSWKKYSGINQLQQPDTLRIKDIVVDTLNVTGNIKGGETILQGDLLITGNLSFETSQTEITISRPMKVDDTLNVTENVTFQKSLQFGSIDHDSSYSLTVSGDTILQGDLLVTGEVKVYGVSAQYVSVASDYRIKTNVTPLDIANFDLNVLKPVEYTLKDSNQTHIGFIAHEVKEHIPCIVSGEKDGENLQRINYIEIIPIIVAEIQNLKKIIEDLQYTNSQLQTCFAKYFNDLQHIKKYVSKSP